MHTRQAYCRENMTAQVLACLLVALRPSSFEILSRDREGQVVSQKCLNQVIFISCSSGFKVPVDLGKV